MSEGLKQDKETIRDSDEENVYQTTFRQEEEETHSDTVQTEPHQAESTITSPLPPNKTNDEDEDEDSSETTEGSSLLKSIHSGDVTITDPESENWNAMRSILLDQAGSPMRADDQNGEPPKTIDRGTQNQLVSAKRLRKSLHNHRRNMASKVNNSSETSGQENSLESCQGRERARSAPIVRPEENSRNYSHDQPSCPMPPRWQSERKELMRLRSEMSQDKKRNESRLTVEVATELFEEMRQRRGVDDTLVEPHPEHISL